MPTPTDTQYLQLFNLIPTEAPTIMPRVQVNGCTSMGEPVRETHDIRQVSPNRGSEDVAVPGVFVPNFDDRSRIADFISIGAKDPDATDSTPQVLMISASSSTPAQQMIPTEAPTLIKRKNNQEKIAELPPENLEPTQTSIEAPTPALFHGKRAYDSHLKFEAIHIDRSKINDGAVSPSTLFRKFATWNIEGFSMDKLVILQHYMEIYSIELLCIQETHICETEHFITDQGNLVIFSGTTGWKYAGVGFIISARLRKSVYSFDCPNGRMAAVKIRVTGGKIAFLSVYASPNDHPIEEQIFMWRLECKITMQICK